MWLLSRHQVVHIADALPISEPGPDIMVGLPAACKGWVLLRTGRGVHHLTVPEPAGRNTRSGHFRLVALPGLCQKPWGSGCL